MEILKENSDCKIYGEEWMNDIIKQVINYFERKNKEYQNFFDLKLPKEYSIYLYDDLKKYRDSHDEEIPEYSRGSFFVEEVSMKSCIFSFEDRFKGDDLKRVLALNEEEKNEIKVQKTNPNRVKTVMAHELAHIYYAYLRMGKMERITWFDEGLVQNLSGEKSLLNDVNELKRFMEKVEKETLVRTDLNLITHEKRNFKTKEYNGYDLSYLSVRYLKENLTNEEFKALLCNKELIERCGKNIVDKSFDYFNNKIKMNEEVLER